MAAVAAEPGATAAPTTAAGDGVEFETVPAAPRVDLQSDATEDYAPIMDLVHQLKDGDAVEECSQVQTGLVSRPEVEAAGKALAAYADDEHIEAGCLRVGEESTENLAFEGYESEYPVAKGERLIERFSPTVEAANEVSKHEPYACHQNSSISDSQPSVVFLHSFPAHPLATEAGLSLAEPAEPTIDFYDPNPELTQPTNIECDYRVLGPSLDGELEPEPANDAPPGSEYKDDSSEDALRERPQPIDHHEDSLPVLERETDLETPMETGYICDFSSVETQNSPELPVSRADLVPSSAELGDGDSCPSPQPRFETNLHNESESESKPSVPCAEIEEVRPESVDHLIPGSEVRVCLDHIIDDALVVSFRLGEKIFSGVLMDLSKRFGPYGIPITVFPKREYKDKPNPESMQLKTEEPFQPKTEKVTAKESLDDPSKEPPQAATASDPNNPDPEPPQPSQQPHPWTNKPPPLFQEGAPYPPPLFIRDTYNQSLPQPPPRKIKRPKRRLYREEPTSIMNAIKLRPRQVLCDKCKGAVATGDKREPPRRGPVSDGRGDDAKRRRSDTAATAGKRSRNDGRSEEKGRAAEASKRQASGIRVASSSSSSSSLGQARGGAGGNRVLRGVSTSSTTTTTTTTTSPSANSSSRVQLNAKKVLQSKNVDHSKAREVLKLAKAQKRQRETTTTAAVTGGGNANSAKTMTRAAALQEAHQKVHFTRRLQQISGVGPSTATPLPPRMRIKPQRYRNEENDSSSPSKSPPQPCLEKVPGGSGPPRLSPPKPGAAVAVSVTPPPRCTSTRSSTCSTGEATAAAPADTQGPVRGPDPDPAPELRPQSQIQIQPQPQISPNQDPHPVPASVPVPASAPVPALAPAPGPAQGPVPAPGPPPEHSDPKAEPEEQGGREERRETRGSKAGAGGNLVVYMTLDPSQPDSSSTTSMCSVDSADDLKSSNSECSSTETFDFPPPGAMHSPPPAPAAAAAAAAPGTSSSSSCTSSSSSSSSSAAADPSPTPKDDKKLSKSGKKAGVFSKNVSKCLAVDGRTICIGDIVWAKIYGFPWWPARVVGITISRKENGLLARQEARVAWFGSPTTSFLALSQLAPFLESFQSRFDKKRKGLYRKAITEAARAAKQLTPEVRALLTQFET